MRSDSGPIVHGTGGDGRSFIEAARRTQIVRCAIDVIAELGYARASLAEIAKRARVSKSVIAYYFGGKDELMLQVVQDVYAAGAAFMLQRMEAQPSPRAQLREYILGNVAFISTHRNHVQALVQIVWNFRDERGESKLDPHGITVAQSALEEVLRRGQDAGEMRTFSTDSMAFAIRAAIDTIPPLMFMQPAIDLDRYARELADAFDRATRAE